ncbi:MAG TPA: saccharopine dehydrogenase C-terminal domain-containing protein [Virgibacillus sp.]|nr:saccharopine dehydrogenase C-terminal domain-containing protein [Virgibacillus sp.]
MKIGVLGSGLMGKETARDLVRSEGVSLVGIADVDAEKAQAVCDHFHSPKLRAFQVDATNHTELKEYMKQFDVIVNALFYTFNEKVAQAAIEVGVHSIDLGGHIGQMTDRVLLLHEAAKAKKVTLIPDLGVAPGMINILSGHGARQLNHVESIKLFVGGIPLRPDPPLEYNHVFSMDGVFDHYTDPSLIIRNGVKQEILSLTEVERIHFDDFGPLEAFHTSGGTSTLSLSYPDLETLEYKTIRYPGHAEKFKLLVDLNLTRKDYQIELNGQSISPRDVLLQVLDPIVELKNKDDAVLLRTVIAGKQGGSEVAYEYEMMTYKDREHNITAMARATASTISIVAQMIGNGSITKRGVYPPEQIVPGEKYLKEMKSRAVEIFETLHKL